MITCWGLNAWLPNMYLFKGADLNIISSFICFTRVHLRFVHVYVLEKMADLS